MSLPPLPPSLLVCLSASRKESSKVGYIPHSMAISTSHLAQGCITHNPEVVKRDVPSPHATHPLPLVIKLAPLSLEGQDCPVDISDLPVTGRLEGRGLEMGNYIPTMTPFNTTCPHYLFLSPPKMLPMFDIRGAARSGGEDNAHKRPKREVRSALLVDVILTYSSPSHDFIPSSSHASARVAIGSWAHARSKQGARGHSYLVSQSSGSMTQDRSPCMLQLRSNSL